MSTGDQSQYLRKKMAERRMTSAMGPDPVFMKSGFQRWAENERPTRMGGAEKEPLAVARDGAKNVLNDVRRLGHQMFQKYYEQSGGARHYAGNESECESDEEDYGGRLMVGDIESNIRGNGMFDSAVGKVALGELGKTIGKVAAPVFEPCETGWKDEGVTCSKTVPKKLKKIGKGLSKCPPTHPIDDGLLCRQPITMKNGKVAGGEVIPKKITKGKGKMECVHHETGEGTVVKKGRGMLEEHAADLMKMAKKGKEGSGFFEDVSDFFTGNTGKKIEARPIFTVMDDEGGSRTVGAGKKKSARGELVKRVMREKGLSLPQASKYVKEHNLYKG